jgi:hypothetical protein
MPRYYKRRGEGNKQRPPGYEGPQSASATLSLGMRVQFHFEGFPFDGIAWRNGRYWAQGARRPLPMVEAEHLANVARDALSEFTWDKAHQITRKFIRGEVTAKAWRDGLTRILLTRHVTHFGIVRGALDPTVGFDMNQLCEADKEEIAQEYCKDVAYIDDLLKYHRAGAFEPGFENMLQMRVKGLFTSGASVPVDPVKMQELMEFSEEMRLQEKQLLA